MRAKLHRSPLPTTARVAQDDRETTTQALLTELVSHLRQNRTQLREEWARRITESRLLTAMTQEETFAEATAVYDNYVAVLETGSVEALQEYARDLSERIIPRGVETHEVLGIVLLLRDVLARSLFEKYQHDFSMLNQVLSCPNSFHHSISTAYAANERVPNSRTTRRMRNVTRVAGDRRAGGSSCRGMPLSVAPGVEEQ